MRGWIMVMGLMVTATGAAIRAEAADAVPPRYESVLRKASALAASGEPEAAAALLEEHEDRFGQDYGFVITLADYQLRSGRSREAAATYGRASTLSGDSVDAQLGLAAALASTGDFADAYRVAQDLKARAGDREDVLALWSAIRELRPRRWAVTAVPLGVAFIGHDFKEWGAGGLVGFDVRPVGPWFVGARYRGLAFRTNQPDLDFAQHEAWVRTGLEGRRADLRVTYGRAELTQFSEFEAHVVGLEAGVFWLGHPTLESAWSHYVDTDVIQIGGSWAVPLGPVWVAPGGAAFIADGEATGAASFAVDVGIQRWRIWARGWFGAQTRPVRLEQSSVYNIPESIDVTAEGGVEFRLGDGWSLITGWEAHYLTSDEDPEAYMHVLNIGFLRRL